MSERKGETTFADPLLEFLIKGEEKERPSLVPAKPATPPVAAKVQGDFKKLAEVEDGDFLSLIEKHTKKKPTKNQSKVDELEKELEEPYVEPPRPAITQMVTEFELLFPKESEPDTNIELLNQKAQKGGLIKTTLRGLCWRIFLGVLTGNNQNAWPSELQAHRDEYERLKQQYLIDPHKADNGPQDLSLNNPLSQASDSPWQQYFIDAELKKQIRLDVIRVYPEREFFKNEAIREMMLRILFIYARENPSLLYKQGMHELLAPILYILDRSRLVAQDPDPADSEERKRVHGLMCTINDERFVEHDAYSMFNKVMHVTAKWFSSGSRHHIPTNKPFNETPFSRDEPLDLSGSSPVVQKCRRIQHELLRRADPELESYLTSMEMEPQLYALRWVRLLLGREFHLEDVLILWDAIFSYGKELILVDYIIVAMLVYIRSQLLHREQQECLHRLFNYPPVEDVLCLIEQALIFINPAVTPTAVSKEKEPPAEPQPEIQHPLETPTVAPISTATASPAPAKPKEHKKSIISTLNSILAEPKDHKPSLSSSLEQQILAQQHQIHILEQRQLHMSNRLERIIFTLQTDLAGTASDTQEVREERRDSMLLALAELKQVKDTLAGLLPESIEGEMEVVFDPPGIAHTKV